MTDRNITISARDLTVEIEGRDLALALGNAPGATGAAGAAGAAGATGATGPAGPAGADGLDAGATWAGGTIYIDAGAGNDANDGLTRGAPIQTWARMNEIRAGYAYQSGSFVLRNIGSANLTVGSFYPLTAISGAARTVVICEQVTVRQSGTLSSGTSTAAVPINTLTADQARGYTIKVGGKRRIALWNNTTSLYAGYTMGSLAGGAAFEILEPTSKLLVAGSAFSTVPLWQDVGSSMSFAPMVLWNVHFSSASAGVFIDCSGSFIHAYGLTISNSCGVQMSAGEMWAGSPSNLDGGADLGATIKGWFDSDAPDLGVTAFSDIQGWGVGVVTPAGSYGDGLQWYGNARFAGFGALEYHYPGGGSRMRFSAASISTSFDLAGYGVHQFDYLQATSLVSPCSVTDSVTAVLRGCVVNDVNGQGLNLSNATARCEVRGTWKGQISVGAGNAALINLTAAGASAVKVAGGRVVISGTSVLTGTAGYAVEVSGGDVFVSAAPGANWTGSTAAIRAGGVSHASSDLASSLSAIIEGGSRLARTT